jgi:hypothetical protein
MIFEEPFNEFMNYYFQSSYEDYEKKASSSYKSIELAFK